VSQSVQSPSFEVRCPACHALLIQVEGNFTRLLGSVKVECRRCGKRRWLRPDPASTETAQKANSTPGTRYNSL
jgi:ssDNA-binding Zn-finger/Zn-ribbon topoisomerase 1